MAIHMDCHGATDIGKVRETNEDQFLIADLKKSLHVFQTSLGVDDQTRLFGDSQGKLLLVADGMGGAAAGERASTLVVDSVIAHILNTLQWYFRLDEHSEEAFVEALSTALRRSEENLSAEVEAIPRRHGMGTTLTMAYIVWPRLYVVHAGDSRCYLFRRKELTQVTEDHSFAQELIDAGALEPEQAERSRWSNVLSNVIGGNGRDVKPEVKRAELCVGDTLLLCTDGLTNHVSDDQLVQQLDSRSSAEELCTRLIETANVSGGSDNITVVAAQFRDAEEETPRAEEAAVPLEATAETMDT